MIKKLSEVMLYMDDLETAKEFWLTKVGFYLVEDIEINGLRRITIAPTINAETKLVLCDQHLVAQMYPELGLDTPSLLFETSDIHKTFAHLQAQGVTVGELMLAPFGLTFHFCDEEHNYFGVYSK